MKFERGVARLALEEVRAVRGSIAIPAGTRVPAGIRTWSQDGELRANAHEVEAWLKTLLRSDNPIKPIKGWK
mgnify:CR=1 FL=1|jgi:hypothetical protein